MQCLPIKSGLACLFIINGVCLEHVVQAALAWSVPLRVEYVAREGAADVTDDVELAQTRLVKHQLLQKSIRFRIS